MFKKLRPTTNKQEGSASIASNGSGDTTTPSDTVADILLNDDADISSSEYARKRRELMELARDLRALGAGGLIDLPSIAVIGGQSAGKSSLVEAISGINVPRDSGTCTRCPMECSMFSSTDAWSCVISLRFEYDNKGTTLPTPRTHEFGPVLSNKNQFEISLRRAQAAILNPHLPHDTFLRMTAQDLKNSTQSESSLKFSKNTVCVDISDPEATDLMFADLPGLIHNESEDMIDLVRSLVEYYIRKPETMILITIPMSDDMENQQAVRLARIADPEGERTIGVLTKPDTLSIGAISARQKWKEVLEGRLHPLKHGYYCVRLPDDDERSRNVTRAASLRLASEFFENTSPWNEVDRRRLGIPGFISDISKLLISLIELALPKLKEDVNRFLIECNEELGSFPAVITNDPHTEVLTRVTEFCTALRDAVLGRSHDRSLVHADRDHYRSFEAKIRLTSPTFIPEAEDTHEDIPPPFDMPFSNSPPKNLHDVRKVIKSTITWELPHNIPFEAKQILIKEYIDRWKQPSFSCFHGVFDFLSDFVESLIETHFGRFKNLERHIRLVTRVELDGYKEGCIEALSKALRLEQFPLFPGDVKDFDSARNEWLAHYRAHWHRYPTRSLRASVSSRCSYAMPEADLEETVDGFDDELTVMADVRAYFQVAHKRIIHSVPMTIEHSLNQPLANNLQQTLLKSLFADSDTTGRMEDLLSEEPAIANARERLESKRARLLEIQTKLKDFKF